MDEYTEDIRRRYAALRDRSRLNAMELDAINLVRKLGNADPLTLKPRVLRLSRATRETWRDWLRLQADIIDCILSGESTREDFGDVVIPDFMPDGGL